MGCKAVRAKVNAWVDEEVAPLVQALSLWPEVLTTWSCADINGKAEVALRVRGGDRAFTGFAKRVSPVTSPQSAESLTAEHLAETVEALKRQFPAASHADPSEHRAEEYDKLRRENETLRAELAAVNGEPHADRCAQSRRLKLTLTERDKELQQLRSQLASVHDAGGPNLRAWQEVERLTAANVRHRKGWRPQDRNAEQALQDALREMFELIREPNNPTEWADVLVCLIAYAQRKGWTLQMLDERAMQKLALRFPQPSQAEKAQPILAALAAAVGCQ